MSLLEVAVLDCCGPDDSAATRKFVAFIRRKFPDTVSVNFFDPEQSSGPEAVPGQLFEQLAAQGVNSVPVLVIDGVVISQGSLPDWYESIEVIERHLVASSETGDPDSSTDSSGDVR